MLPERKFYSSSLLVEALATALETTEDELRLSYPAIMVDTWLELHGISCPQYLYKVVNRKSTIDGLFVWLVAWSCQKHINIFHALGVWTSRECDIAVFTDAALVFVVHCFLAVPAMRLTLSKRDLDSDPEYICPFKLPGAGYVTIPPVLNKPVHSSQQTLDNSGLVPLTEELHLEELFTQHLQCTLQVLREELVRWIGRYNTDLQMIEKWLAVRGLTLADYIMHLRNRGTSDGLEVWMLSLVLDLPMNIFLEDRACSTSQQGLDLQFLSIVLTMYHTGIWCKEGDDEAVAAPEILMEPVRLAPRKVCGHHCIREEAYPQEDSSTETDPDELLEMLVKVCVPSLLSGVPRPRLCPVYQSQLDSGLALE